MFSALLLTILPPTTQPTIATAPAVLVLDAEYDKRKNEAGKDLAKLWQLYEWCKEQKREKDGKATLKAILKVDPNHREANEASGNLFFDGKWFANQKKVDEYKKAKEDEEARAKGLVSYKGQWVPAEDLPFLERGLTRDENGNWVSAEEAKKLAEGWTKQDLQWIDPKDKEKVAQGLWKCGAEWLPLDKANDYHNDIADWWQVPGDKFVFYSTIDRSTLEKRIVDTTGYAYADMERVFGAKPSLPPVVVLLRDAEQYGSYAAGSRRTSARRPRSRVFPRSTTRTSPTWDSSSSIRLHDSSAPGSATGTRRRRTGTSGACTACATQRRSRTPNRSIRVPSGWTR